MKPVDMEVFTHYQENDTRTYPVLIGSCPWCCRLHKFPFSLRSRLEAVKLTGQIRTPEAHRLHCEAFSEGVTLVVRDEPMSLYRRPLTDEKPEDWNRWIRITPPSDEPPF